MDKLPVELLAIEKIAVWDTSPNTVGIGIKTKTGVVSPIGTVNEQSYNQSEITEPMFSMTRHDAELLFNALGRGLGISLDVEMLKSKAKNAEREKAELESKVNTLMSRVSVLELNAEMSAKLIQTNEMAAFDLRNNLLDLRSALEREIERAAVLEDVEDMTMPDLKEAILLFEEQSRDADPNIPKTKAGNTF